ncbi:MAG: GntR family transcriptional regulator [Spirochaetales bacterium]|nr:GntR family transcriptional regulator [Spirochaetales bacterium]
MNNRKKIEKISVVEQLTDYLKQDILDRKWAVGEKIPSESDIADKYGVNRLSVRMALQKLNTLGVIETRVGEGSFVKDFSMYSIFNEIADYYYSSDRFEEIKETRRLIERECIKKAAKLATDEEKKVLKNNLDKYLHYREQIQKDFSKEVFEDTIAADFSFHSQIVSMSHNQLYQEIYYMVQKLIRAHIASLIEKRRFSPEYMDISSPDEHVALYENICNGDFIQAHKYLDKILDIKDSEPAE